MEQAYPPNSRVFVMAPSVQAFGYPCLVDAIEDPNKASCRVRIKCALTAQPDLTPIRNDIQAHSLRWYDGYGACKQVNSEFCSVVLYLCLSASLCLYISLLNSPFQSATV